MKAIALALLAKLPWVNYWFALLLIKSAGLFQVCRQGRSPCNAQTMLLAIEAGAQGWSSIEFKELYSSAVEYFGEDRVIKIIIDKSLPYVPQVEAAIRRMKITHYFYDPRTGQQSLLRAFLESMCLAIILSRHDIVPIVYLTDLSVRIWRCQAAAVSANRGIVVTFMMPKLVQRIFPHRRLVGPSLMPFSIEKLYNLRRIRSQLVAASSIRRVVRFAGSLYEPRTTFLRLFKQELDASGHIVEVLGRKLGSPRVTDDEYWMRISSACIVITTATQALQPGCDCSWIPHLVYRYLEVLAAGSLLMAPRVPGVSRYFEPAKHFVCYDSLEDAIVKARFYLDNIEEAEKVRLAGHKKAQQLILSHCFWLQIDTALGIDSFLV